VETAVTLRNRILGATLPREPWRGMFDSAVEADAVGEWLHSRRRRMMPTVKDTVEEQAHQQAHNRAENVHQMALLRYKHNARKRGIVSLPPSAPTRAYRPPPSPPVGASHGSSPRATPQPKAVSTEAWLVRVGLYDESTGSIQGMTTGKLASPGMVVMSGPAALDWDRVGRDRCLLLIGITDGHLAGPALWCFGAHGASSIRRLAARSAPPAVEAEGMVAITLTHEVACCLPC